MEGRGEDAIKVFKEPTPSVPGTVAMTMPQILPRQLLVLEVGMAEAVDLHTEAGWGERSGVSGNIPAEKMAGADRPHLLKALSLPLPLPLASAPQLLPGERVRACLLRRL